jgi:hypothetical protein
MRLYVINNGKEALARSLIQREIYLLAIATQIDAGVFPIQEIAAHTYIHTHSPALFSPSLTRCMLCAGGSSYAARLDGRNLMPLLCNADIYFVFPAAEKRLKSAFSCMCVRESRKRSDGRARRIMSVRWSILDAAAAENGPALLYYCSAGSGFNPISN